MSFHRFIYQNNVIFYLLNKILWIFKMTLFCLRWKIKLWTLLSLPSIAHQWPLSPLLFWFSLSLFLPCSLSLSPCSHLPTVSHWKRLGRLCYALRRRKTKYPTIRFMSFICLDNLEFLGLFWNSLIKAYWNLYFEIVIQYEG